MVLHGRVENGTVVLTDGVSLPNGTEVTVIVPSDTEPSGDRPNRVQLPLVPSKHPGSLQLGADRVAAILTEDELSC